MSPIPTNDATRWVRVVYGSTDLGGGNTANSNIPNVVVGSTTVTDASGNLLFPGGYFPASPATTTFGAPDAFGVVEVPSSVTDPRGLLEQIITTSAVGQEVGQRFWVRLDYWNKCNPYDGVGDIGNLRVSIENYIEIIDIPPDAVGVDTGLCTGDALSGVNFEITGTTGTVTAVNWYDGDPNAGGNPVTNPINTNSTIFPASSFPGGLNTNIPGEYSMWATYVVGATNSCESDPVESVITVREDLARPDPITGSSEVCNGTNNVSFSLPTPAGSTTFGGAVEYEWSSTGGAGVNLDATTGQSITADFNIGGSFTSVTRTIRARRKYSSAPDCYSPYRSFTVTIYGQTLGGTVTSDATICEGDNTGTLTLTGHRGTILNWQRDSGGGYVDIGNAGSATFNETLSTAGVYHYRAVVENGVCATEHSVEATITVNPVPSKPTITEVGDGTIICEDGSQVILQSDNSGGNADEYAWFKDPDTTTPIQQSTSNQLVLDAVAESGRYYVRTIGIDPSDCQSELSDHIDIVINPLPSASSSGGGAVCAGNPAPDIVWAIGSGTGPFDYEIEINGVPQGLVSGHASSTIIVDDPLVAGTYELVYLEDANGCVATTLGAVRTVTIGGTPPILENPLSVEAAVCDDGASTDAPDITIDLTDNTAGKSYDVLYSINGGGTITETLPSDASGRLFIQPDYVADLGTTPGTYAYEIRSIIDNATTCAANINLAVDVIINPRPIAPTNPTDAVSCSSASVNSLSVDDPGAGFTVRWYTAFTDPITNTPVTGADGAVTGSNDRIFTPATTANATFFAAVENNATGCLSTSAVTLTHTEDPAPFADADLDGDATNNVTCDGDFALAANVPASGETGTWTGPGGVTFSDPNNPTTLAQNLPIGTSVLTWTVETALGECSAATDNISVERYPLPDALDPAPALCELVEGGGEVTGIDLEVDYNDQVTDIVNSTDRTVEWFTDAARTTPVSDVNNYTASVGTTRVYTRVTDITTGCTQDGEVNFTILSLPEAIDQTDESCENALNSNEVDGIDLTSYNAAIIGAANPAERTVDWYFDPGYTSPIPPGTVTNITFLGPTRTFYARVTDTSNPESCTNDAQLDFTILPLPEDNPIIGPSTQCVGSSIELYQIDPLTTPGSTYTWNIPADFTLFAGGGPNDFFVLLSFPSVATGTIEVYETSTDGCDGNVQSLTIDVVSSPPPLTISPNPAVFCENEAGVVFSVASLPNTDYAWTVPTGASIISGQGTNQITVNLGAFGGNVSVVPTSTTGNCPGTPATRTVTINRRPDIDKDLDNTVCSDDFSGITFTDSGLSTEPAASYDITAISVDPGLIPGGSNAGIAPGQSATAILNDVYTNQTGGQLSVRYTVQPRSADDCLGASEIITLRINAEPRLSANLDQEKCSDQVSGINLAVATGSVPATSYNIVSVNPGGLTPGAGNATIPQNGVAANYLANDTYTNTTSASVDVEYIIAPVSVNGCIGDPPFILRFTVNPEPVGTDETKPVVCSNVAFSFDLQDNVNVNNGLTSSFAWTATYAPGITGGTGAGTGNISETLRNQTGAQLNAVYTVTPTESTNGCNGEIFIITVPVDPEPVGVDETKTAVCSDIAFNFDPQTNISNGLTSTFTWLAAYDAGLAGGSVSGSGNIAETLTNVTGTTLHAVYTITPTDNITGCDGEAFTITVPINPEPDGNDETKVPVCSNVGFNFNPQTNITNGRVSSFVWTASYDPGLTGGAGSGTGNLSETLVNTTSGVLNAEYTVTPTDNVNPTCTGDDFVIIVPVNPEPVGTSDTKVAVCSGIAFDFDPQDNVDLNNGVTSNFTWTASYGPGITGGAGAGSGHVAETLTNLSGGTENAIYTIVPTADGTGCSGSLFTITVPIDPQPIAVDQAFTICSDMAGGNTATVDLTMLNNSVNGGTANTVTWYSDALLSVVIATPTAYAVTDGIPVFAEIDDGNCQNSASVTYTINPLPSIIATVTSNYNGAHVSCSGASNGQITATPGDGTPTYQYSIDGGATYTASNVFNGLPAGTYVVRVRDARGCEVDSSPVDIIDPTPVAANATVTSSYNGEDISCNGANDGEITVTASGGTGAYTYTLNEIPSNTTGAITGIFTGLADGTYTVDVRDANNCFVTTLPITLDEPSDINAIAVVSRDYNGSDVSCTGVGDGEITVTVPLGEGVGTLSYVLIEIPSNTTGATSGVFTGLPQGSYTVRVTDDNNCQKVTAPVIISNPPSLSATASVTSNYNGSHISCNGANDAVITVTANGGTGAYSYQLNEIPANTSGATTGIFTNIPPGTYTFNVRDANLCLITTASVSVFQPVTLNANATITSNYNGSPISCNGASDGQITISATGGTGAYGYVLNELPANTSGAANGIFTGVPAGTYTFNVTDANGCLFIAGPVTINQPNAINATATVTSNYNSAHVSCNGATNAQVTVSATGGTGAFTYTLIENPANTSGIATGVFTGLGAGTHTFFIEDVNSCDFTTIPVTVIEPDPVAATPSITQAIDCFGNSTGEITVSATGGTGSYTFDLNEIPTNNTGLTTGVYTNLPAGTYTFDVLDVNGCGFTTGPITIGQPTEVIASASVISNYNGTQISCAGADDGIIEVTASGGTGGYSYAFNEIPGNTSGVTSGIFTDVPAGTYTFNVEDANGCLVTTTTVTITEPAPVSGTLSISSNYNGEDVSCFGASDGEITVSASGGNGTYSYLLSGIPGNTTGATSGIFTGLAAGSYTVEIEDVNGCTATTAPITITQPAAVTASAASDISYNGFDISCFGTSDGRIRVTASNGVSPYSYVLDQIPTNISGASTGIFTGVPAGIYTFTVTDANGCDFVTSSVTLAQPVALSGTATVTSNYNGADISCYLATNGEVTVTVAGGAGTYTYLLNEDPANTSGATSGVFTGMRAGTYTFRITDANNCNFVTTPVTIDEPDPIDLTIEITSNHNGEHLSCSGASDATIEVTVISGGTPNYTYELLDNLGTSYGTNNTGVFAGLGAGVYKVLATDVNNCSKESFPVVVIPPFPLSAGFISGTQNVCVGEAPSAFTELSAPFGGIGDYQYQWEVSNDNFVGDVNNVPGANAATYSAPAEATSGTLYYRRRVESGTCAPTYTNVITVTVNPLPTGATVSGPTDICEGDAFILQFNFPVGQAPFKFNYEDDKGNTYTDVFGASTTPVFVTFGEVTSTTTYTITRVEDINGCVDFPVGAGWTVNVVNISAEFDIVGPSDGCSPATIEFEYDQIDDVTYTWQWFDGTADSSYTADGDIAGMRVRHTFANGSPNNTFNYNVFLTASIEVGGKQCTRQSNESVTVYPTILPNVFTVNSPVCSGDEIYFTNSTAGATQHRWFYREQGNVGQELGVQTVQNASFTINNTGPNNPQVYEVVYAGSKNNGGEVCSASQVVEVEVYKEVVPDFSFSPSSPTFTAGSALVTFTNQSNPADDPTNFSYNWDFSDGITMTDTPEPGVINYTQPGIKSVKLTVVNKEAPGFCDVQVVKNVDIKDVPISVNFEVTPEKGCIPTTVTITNTTTGSANEFTWQVFDGNNQTVYENVQLADPDQPPLPQIKFDLYAAGAYSVRLTGRNTITNQTASVIRDSVIVIFPQPLASFDLRPDVVFLPDQPIRTFNFSHQADQYHWDFGDGGTSEEFEPEYLYSFEGTFNVVLTAYTDYQDGVICADTLSRQVVAQEGGATRIPNAFTPDINGPSGDGRIQNEVNNDIFLPITQGVEEFQMLIFDRWGSLIFESNDQTVGWDGYDKNGRLLPAGVYVYKLTLRLSNGSRTTRIGDVTLIR
ncbi:hypothetical protein C900_05934 [Fulvivirga imtechensis AK7]|uniref:PKD domain-containing protein n=1 Tax=Fulvivirga imtechensis AK7 TaxID=1237149 RepID=L8JIG6_9BACT|nr:hypothetical protein C900_05934 [Fulvivirga imtechensis AK7]